MVVVKALVWGRGKLPSCSLGICISLIGIRGAVRIGKARKTQIETKEEMMMIPYHIEFEPNICGINVGR